MSGVCSRRSPNAGKSAPVGRVGTNPNDRGGRTVGGKPPTRRNPPPQGGRTPRRAQPRPSMAGGHGVGELSGGRRVRHRAALGPAMAGPGAGKRCDGNEPPRAARLAAAGAPSTCAAGSFCVRPWMARAATPVPDHAEGAPRERHLDKLDRRSRGAPILACAGETQSLQKPDARWRGRGNEHAWVNVGCSGTNAGKPTIANCGVAAARPAAGTAAARPLARTTSHPARSRSVGPSIGFSTSQVGFSTPQG